jgi:predicted RNase H-like HicB family nuclease
MRHFDQVDSKGETFEELLENLYEAVEACLAVDTAEIEVGEVVVRSFPDALEEPGDSNGFMVRDWSAKGTNLENTEP